MPEKWFPQDALDADSFAFGVLFGGKPDDPMPRRIGAEAWFDRWDAQSFELHEQTFRTGPGEILTLVLISDSKMLDEHQERRWR